MYVHVYVHCTRAYMYIHHTVQTVMYMISYMESRNGLNINEVEYFLVTR
jgi:hypothetical protein